MIVESFWFQISTSKNSDEWQSDERQQRSETIKFIWSEFERLLQFHIYIYHINDTWLQA